MWEMVKWEGCTLVQYGWNVRAVGKQQQMRVQITEAAVKITTGLRG